MSNAMSGKSTTSDRIGSHASGSGRDFDSPRTDDLREGLGEVGTGLSHAAAAAVPAAKEQMQRVKENVTQGAESLEKSLTTCVREKPMQSLLIAAGVGIFAGLFLLRR